MSVKHNLIIYLLKASRSFSTGFASALTIYFYYRNVLFWEGTDIPFSIACIIFASTIKSAIIVRYRRSIGHLNCLILGYLLQLFPLIIANDINLGLRGSVTTFTIYLSLGFFPFDGEDFAAFQIVEKGYLRQENKENKEDYLSLYGRVGYIAQAAGSLALGAYLFQAMEDNYDEKLYVHWALLALCAFTLIGLLLSLVLSVGSAEVFGELAAEEAQSTAAVPRRRLRVHSWAEGVAVGLVSAPFLAYYCELKLDYYYDAVGLLLAAFFLLKGIGREVVSRTLMRQSKMLRGMSLLSSLAMVVAALLGTLRAATVFLVCAFPLWHLGRVKVQEKVGEEESGVASSLREDLHFWQRIGVCTGMVIGAASYSILFYKWMFGYPFLAYACIKHLNFQLILQIQVNQPINQNEIIQEQQSANFNQSLKDINNQVNNKKPSNNSAYNPESTGRKCFRWILLFVVAFLLYFFYFNTFSQDKFTEAFKLMYPRLGFKRPKELRLFNASLAEYLFKQNYTHLQLIHCDHQCQNTHRANLSFAEFELNSTSSQWMHFPDAPYFTNNGQIREYFDPIFSASPQIKGFSVFWKHPIRYHKIAQKQRQYIKEIAEDSNYFYQQMTSLNLRGVEDKIVLIFSRQTRKPVLLPKFVDRIPQKNVMGLQTTLKLVRNLPELREFILYHLKLGVDKFFIYDNDPPHDDPTLFQGNRIVEYYQKCLKFNLSQQYSIFQQIWEQFYDHIIYIPYCKARKNEYIQHYPQNQAFQHYYQYFKEAVRYTAFTDVDQFIYSASGSDLPQTFLNLQREHNIGTVYLVSKFFQNNVCNPGKLVIETFNWSELPAVVSQAQKIIMMNSLIVRPIVHERQPKNGGVAFRGSSIHDFQLWHYQLTSNFLTKIHNIHLKEYHHDEAMKPFVEGLKQACRGKCTDSFKTSCSEEEDKKYLQHFCALEK